MTSGLKNQMSPDEKLAELREFVAKYGAELTSSIFSKESKTKSSWQRHWGSWNRFIGEIGLHKQSGHQPKVRTGAARANVSIKDGVVFVGSDAHYWPDDISTAHKAFVALAKKMKPDIVILNGDELDGATISRFQHIGWERKPSLDKEIEAVKDRLHEIFLAAPNAKRLWTLGNHDGRFESIIANKLPELAKVEGVHLKDHFPAWSPAWSVWINGHYKRPCMVKHRIKGGIHAPRNNVLAAGCHTVTGHLHAQRVHAHTNYMGTWYGVDAGTMLEPGFGESWGGQVVDYTEDNPLDWRAGFTILTFKDWELMPPDLVHVIETGVVWFRGQRIEV